MRIIASFTGRGIDVHDNLDAQSNQTYSLLMNLRDGVATGRVRGFIVDSAGADVVDDVRAALESGELSLDALDPPALTELERVVDGLCSRTGLPRGYCECYNHAELPNGFRESMVNRYALVWNATERQWYRRRDA